MRVNSTLTWDLSQTISCPWLLLIPSPSSPPFLSLLLPFPLRLNNLPSPLKSLCPPSICVWTWESDKSFSFFSVSFSKRQIGPCWPLNLQTKKTLEAIYQYSDFFLFFFVRGDQFCLENVGHFHTNSNQTFWALIHFTWFNSGIKQTVEFKYSGKTASQLVSVEVMYESIY